MTTHTITEYTANKIYHTIWRPKKLVYVIRLAVVANTRSPKLIKSEDEDDISIYPKKTEFVVFPRY